MVQSDGESPRDTGTIHIQHLKINHQPQSSQLKPSRNKFEDGHQSQSLRIDVTTEGESPETTGPTYNIWNQPPESIYGNIRREVGYQSQSLRIDVTIEGALNLLVVTVVAVAGALETTGSIFNIWNQTQESIFWNGDLWEDRCGWMRKLK